jgi:hypothetical protein
MDASSHARRERIVVLLENYTDVEAGLRDRGSDGEHIPLMCRPWNTPKQGYPELDHQLGLMRSAAPSLYWHLAEMYFRAPSRRVLQCPRCRGVMPTWSSVNFHKHGHSNVAIVPRVVSVVRPGVQASYVEQAVGWLDEAWSGEVFLPDELMAA